MWVFIWTKNFSWEGLLRGGGAKVFWNIYILMIMQSLIVKFHTQFLSWLSFGRWNIYVKNPRFKIQLTDDKVDGVAAGCKSVLMEADIYTVSLHGY